MMKWWYLIMKYMFPMCRNNLMKMNPLKNSRGSSLVIAIFILVVMSVLGASMSKVLRSNEQTYAYEVLGTRAYTTAQSGAQRKLQEIFPIGAATDNDACKSEEFDFSAVEGINNCKANVVCSSKSHSNSGQYYFTIESTGSCDINGETTSRRVEVKARG